MYKGVVYRLVNRDTGQSYVGRTFNLRKRLWQHKTAANKIGTKNEGQPIVQSIRKLGLESFDVEVLYESPEFEDKKELDNLLNEMEIFFIEKYDSINNGYNRTKGGAGMLGFSLSESAREAISRANTGRVFDKEHRNDCRIRIIKRWEDEEFRKKMSERFSGKGNPMYGVHLRGENNPNFGKPKSEETKRKISEAKTGKPGTPVSEEHKRKLSELHKGKPKSESQRKKLSEAITGTKVPKKWKPILQYSLEGVFIKEWPSVSEAQEACQTKHIGACATGKRNNAAGFIWRYKTSDKIPQTIEIPNPKSHRAIAQVDENGKIIRKFSTIREASKALGLNYSGISAVLQGLQRKTGNNYRFIYID